MSARIEHKWRVDRQQELGVPNRYIPNPDWWTGDFSVIYSVGRLDARQAHNNVEPFIPDGCPAFIYHETLTRLTFTAPDGTEYELRDQLTNGLPDHPTCTTGFNRGRVFTTSDGTSATFVSDADIFDSPDGTGAVIPYGYLTLRDGTRYRIEGGMVSWMRDRNGNKLTFAYYGFQKLGSVTDSLNRQVIITYATQSVPYDQITINGFGGAPRTIKVYQTALRYAYRSDFTELTGQQMFPELDQVPSAGGYPVVSAVELPNGQQYQFKYNSYAELARVVLPTGGAIEYDYAAGLTNGVASGVINVSSPYPVKEIYRRVVERRVYPDGGSGTGYATRMTYSRPETTTSNLGYVTTDQYDSNGALLSRSNHYFYGSPRASFSQQPTQYPGWKDGREYQTTVYASDGTTPLRQVVNTFVQRASVSWWTGGADQEPPNDPRLVETDTTLWDTNQVSKQIFGYDDSVLANNQNNVKEYDFDGTLRRETRTTYVTSASYTVSDVNLLSLPDQISVFDGEGKERARTKFEYDNYVPDDGNLHAGLVTRSSISGLCDGTSQNCAGGPNFGSQNYVTRGNVTTSIHYLLDPSGNGTVIGLINGYLQYDVAGNVVKFIDPRSTPTNVIATSVDFSDCFGAPDGNARINGGPTELNSVGQTSYAFPTLVTNALGQTAYTQFDY
jgi:hypothetical protein